MSIPKLRRKRLRTILIHTLLSNKMPKPHQTNPLIPLQLQTTHYSNLTHLPSDYYKPYFDIKYNTTLEKIQKIQRMIKKIPKFNPEIWFFLYRECTFVNFTNFCSNPTFYYQHFLLFLEETVKIREIN